MHDDTEQLATLLRDTTATLDPDVRRLVQAGMARGRKRRQRQRRNMVLAGVAVATIATIGLTSLVLGHASTNGGDADLAADPSSRIMPTHVTRTAISGPGIARRELAVDPVDIPSTFALIHPGAITAQPRKEQTVPIADFRWNGFAIRVGFSTADQQAGYDANGDPLPPESLTAMERCRRYAEGAKVGCQPGPDESAVTTLRDDPRNGEVVTNWAFVYTADGWAIWVSAANAAGKEGVPIAEEPPFTVQQLLEVAQSDLWFE